MNHNRRFPRLPPETLNVVFRKISRYPDVDRRTLLSVASVSSEWRHLGWPHVWKEFVIDAYRKNVAATLCRFSLPWAQKVTRGIQVRDLAAHIAYDGQMDSLASLFALPFFSGIRILNLHSHKMDQYFTTTFHLLMVFRSLPNLVSLSLGFLTDEPVSWGKNLRLAEEEEDEIWRMGLGNLKALKIGLMEQSHTGGIMLGKLALGLGERLEMMHVGLRDPGTDDQIAQLLRNLSNNCPRLVDLSFEGWNPNSLQPFLKTQRQIVQLALKNMNVSDRFLRTIVASCTNLRFLEFDAGDNIPSATYKHLAKLPFLRGLSIHGNGVDRIAKTDVVEFLRCRGKDLEYLKFPRGRIGAFPGLVEFLPNIRHFSTWYQYPFDYVVDFLDSAPKLESIQLCTEGWIVEMLEEVWDHDVELNYEDHDFRMQMHDHVESKKEAWMGL